MYRVQKRNGTFMDFDIHKIANAMTKAFVACDQPVDESIVEMLALKVTSDFAPKVKDNTISVEDIQDSVESILAQAGYMNVAKAYILYRENHTKARNAGEDMLNYKKVVDGYLKIDDWRVKENSTVTYSIGGLILSNSGAITANYWLNEIYDKEIRDAHKNVDMHIHDLSMLTGYCAGWSLKQLIQEGIGGVPGKITSAPASHLSTLCNQMVNFLGILQNEWAGAQAFSSFDTYLAPFVKADNLTYKEVKQCIQSFVYGVNTPSRWGCCTSDTEVLSTTGWKKYNELKEGDLIYTWHDGRLELNPVRKVVVKPFKGQMHAYIARGYNQTVTPTHRMLVKKHNVDEYAITHSEDIFNVKIPYCLPVAFKSVALDDIGLSDAEIRMAAALYTDGNFDMRGEKVHKIKIFKSPKRVGADIIEADADELGLTYTKTESHGDFGPVLVYTFYGDSARALYKLTQGKKRIAAIFCQMSQKQSELFLNTWALFDGDEHKMRLQYDNDEIAAQLQHIALRAGRCSYLYSNGKANYVKVRQVDNIYPTTRTAIDYDDIVWCPNVENGTAVFRKDGCVFISGQTQSPFTNITLDWTVPSDLAELNAIVGGKEMPYRYKDCKKEMDMINKAFLEIMIEGDANGRGFQYPIPTYSITKNFDWSNTENNRLLFEMTAKYGTPYFSNYINSDLDPSDVRSMCCRLQLDLRELRRKSGGFFGSGESTGSVAVVSLNIPRLAYLATDEKDFYARLDKLMDIAARSIKLKRTAITKFMENGLYPYTKRYLGSFDNHFSTLGLVGVNEACLNAKWLRCSIADPKGKQFAVDLLNHMRERLSDYQEKYGDLYNLEATPAESTAYRFAMHDKKRYPDIITAGGECGTPYYTNSTNLPVNYTEDIFSALDHQDDLHVLYTSGTVFHAFQGEKLPSWEATAALVRKIAENYKLPYFSMSPTYSICKNHGYLNGEQFKCPECGEDTEVYSRITGYYRPVQNWNDGKVAEYKDRKEYTPFKKADEFCESCQIPDPLLDSSDVKLDAHTTEDTVCENCHFDTSADDACDCCTCETHNESLCNCDCECHDKGLFLIATKECPKCKLATEYLTEAGINFTKIYAEDDATLVHKFGLTQAPVLIDMRNDEAKLYTNLSDIRKFIEQ